MTSPSARDGRPRLRVLVLRHQLTADTRHSRRQGRVAVRPPERVIQPPDERDAVLLREARENWALHLPPPGRTAASASANLQVHPFETNCTQAQRSDSNGRTTA